MGIRQARKGEEDYLSGMWKKGGWCSENAVFLKRGLLTASASPWGRPPGCRIDRIKAGKPLNSGKIY